MVCHGGGLGGAFRRDREHVRLTWALCVVAVQQVSTATAAEDGEIQEITVTATRREESLQRVPVAVSVLKGTDMEAQSLANLQDVSSILPALNFRTGASSKDRDVFIRGIGTTG